MKKIKFIRIALFLFGSIAIGIGGALLFFPIPFQASAGIILDENIGLLSEMRAYGSLILSSGIIILSGAFTNRLLSLSIGLSCLFYLSIAVSRIISMVMDGIPTQTLVSATIAETMIGLISLYMFLMIGKQASVAI